MAAYCRLAVVSRKVSQHHVRGCDRSFVCKDSERDNCADRESCKCPEREAFPHALKEPEVVAWRRRGLGFVHCFPAHEIPMPAKKPSHPRTAASSVQPLLVRSESFRRHSLSRSSMANE